MIIHLIVHFFSIHWREKAKSSNTQVQIEKQSERGKDGTETEGVWEGWGVEGGGRKFRKREENKVKWRGE